MNRKTFIERFWDDAINFWSVFLGYGLFVVLYAGLFVFLYLLGLVILS